MNYLAIFCLYFLGFCVCKTPRSPLIEPWWHFNSNGDPFFIFSVINEAPNYISNEELGVVLDAIKYELDNTFYESYGITAEFAIYDGTETNNPRLYRGDTIPCILSPGDGGRVSGLGYHWIYIPGQDPYFSPPSNFPIGNPYGQVFTGFIEENINTGFYTNNPNALQHLNDFISFVLFHEVAEILADDDTNHYVWFDQKAIAVKGWMWSDNACGPLVPFTQRFPSVQLLTQREVGDPVSRSICSKVLSFKGKNGVVLTDYVLSPEFYAYSTQNNLQYDRMGLLTEPMQTYCALWEGVILIDQTTSISWEIVVTNNGVVSAKQSNNQICDYPANTTYVTGAPITGSGSKSGIKGGPSIFH